MSRGQDDGKDTMRAVRPVREREYSDVPARYPLFVRAGEVMEFDLDYNLITYKDQATYVRAEQLVCAPAAVECPDLSTASLGQWSANLYIG